MTEITLKQGTGAPASGDLVEGEIAVDTTTLTLYAKDSFVGFVAKVGSGDFLALDGSNAMSGDIDLVSAHTVKNVSEPVDDHDVATKLYVDSLSQSAGYDDTRIQGELDQEILDRQAADQSIQDQIDDLDLTGETPVTIGENPPSNPEEGQLWFCSLVGSEGLFCYSNDPNDPTVGYWFEIVGAKGEDGADGSGGGASDWASITGKPTEFTPEAHTHVIADVTGLQDALDNAGEVEEAPEDGSQYARQDAGWVPVQAGSSIVFTLPVTTRTGALQLPLTPDGLKLAVMTRGGEIELPLAA